MCCPLLQSCLAYHACLIQRVPSPFPFAVLPEELVAHQIGQVPAQAVPRLARQGFELAHGDLPSCPQQVEDALGKLWLIGK